MTVWFVSGHAGAVDWARRRGIEAEAVAHLDVAKVKAGDRVIGTLPVSLAAAVCAGGAEYWHLTLDLPPEARRRELSADDMDTYGARIERYEIRRMG